MHSTTCLNCNTELSGKFCSGCGQKADTHRITAKHFILHDLVHGVWHVDKGMAFTIKETFTRPGYAARDYIAGKRIKYYNIFYLLLLLLGLMLFAGNYVEGGLIGDPNTAGSEEAQKVNEVLGLFPKLLYLSFVPVLALVGMLMFRRLKLNFFEHNIIAGFTTLGVFLFIFFSLLLESANNYYATIISNCIGVLCAVFPAYAYFQFTRGSYTIAGFLWRIAVFYILFIVYTRLVSYLAFWLHNIVS